MHHTLLRTYNSLIIQHTTHDTEHEDNTQQLLVTWYVLSCVLVFRFVFVCCFDCCVFVAFFVCFFVCLVCVSYRFHCGSTLRVPRAETRLTVYRSSYIPVRWCLGRLFPPRFLITIDKSCIVKLTIVILL